MDSQTKNQNQVSPNYDFILQQGAGGHSPGGKKPTDKRVIFIIAGTLLLVVIFGGSLLFGAVSKNVQPDSGDQALIDTSQTSQELVNKLAAQDYTGAATALGETDPNAVGEQMREVFNDFDPSTCATAEPVQDQLPGAFVVSCRAKNKDATLSIQVQTVVEDSQTIVAQYEVEAS